MEARAFFCGFREGLDVPRLIKICTCSRTLRGLALYSAMFNGCVFFGTSMVLHFFVAPYFRSLFSIPAQPEPFSVGNFIMRPHHYINFGDYLIIQPLGLLSILYGIVWNQDIATRAIKLKGSLQQSNDNVLASLTKGVFAIGDEIVRYSQEVALRVLSFIIYTILSFIPVVGLPVGIAVHLIVQSWIYSFQAFLYIWDNRGIKQVHCVKYFESHWVYFIGFGFPLAVAIWILPTNAGVALRAMMLSFHIMMAAVATPIKSASNVRIFEIPERVVSKFVKYLVPSRQEK